jgi:hypothetical protein
MTEEEVLELAKDAVRAGRARLTFHAEMESGPKRGARYHDIKKAVLTATSAKRKDLDVWCLQGGRDYDEDDLTVVVRIEAQSIRIITVY